MITPIQRLPRYVLLIEDLVKNTPQWHVDHKALESSLSGIRAVSHAVNEAKRGAENREQLLQMHLALTPPLAELVQPSREFVMSGWV